MLYLFPRGQGHRLLLQHDHFLLPYTVFVSNCENTRALLVHDKRKNSYNTKCVPTVMYSLVNLT